MQLINIGNYATQIGGISTAGDTIVNDLSTGKQYQYKLGQWVEYFKVSAGGNVVVTPLAGQVPGASISDVKTVDSPYTIEPIDNICRINATSGLALANVTYGRLYVNSFTGKITSLTVFNTTAVGNIQLSIYSVAGALLAKTASTAATSGIQNIPLNQNAAGGAITGWAITGGAALVVAITATAGTNVFAGFSGQPTTSITGPAAQWYGSTATPATLTANGSNQAFAPWIAILCS